MKSNNTHLTYAQVQNIEKQGVSAFYFLDMEKLKSNYQELQQAFNHEYENCQIAYSFKTNYAPMICAVLKSLGCWAEVVSAMEYDIATQAVGYDPQQIIVNGPLHEAEFIERALLEGALINADAWYILEEIAKICAKYPQQQFQIGVRLNYHIKEGGFSRFGINSRQQNLQRLSDWQKAVANCEIIGFHSHFSNSSRSLSCFDSRISGLLTASESFFEKKAPQFINVGGGFFGDMPTSLASQYGERLPNFTDYAKQICNNIKKRFTTEKSPKLLLEPGTALVANAMVFVCKVYEVKQLEEKTIALVNGSNHNVNHKWQGESLPIEILRQNPDHVSNSGSACFDIVANTCIEKDVLCTDVSGSIRAGDYVVFQYMGAYSNVLKQPFIHPCQAIYTTQNQQLIVVKRQETATDILASYTCKEITTEAR